MSDEQFRRPGEAQQPAVESWPYEQPPADDSPVPPTAAEGTPQGLGKPPEKVRSTPRRSVQLPVALGVGTVALLTGFTVGAVAIDRPNPPAFPLTVKTFPRELLGKVRNDIEWREGRSEAVIKRLDTNFEDQLRAHEFAYGGEGAKLSYGNFYHLTILNGRLTTTVPTADVSDWEEPIVVSLKSTTTSCVSSQPPAAAPYETSMDPDLLPTDEDGNIIQQVGNLAWTDCVLHDKARNLSLRIEGSWDAEDILASAGTIRDELERIHADLTD